MNLATPKAGAKNELLFNKPAKLSLFMNYVGECKIYKGFNLKIVGVVKTT